MKKFVKLSIAAACLTAVSGMAFAEKPGFYVGAGAGVSRLDTPNQFLYTNEQVAGLNAKQTKTLGGIGGRVFTGYNLNQNLGIELGLAKYADSKYKSTLNNGVNTQITNLTYSLSAIDLVAKGYVPVSDSGVSLYGLGGVAYVSSKVGGNTTVDQTEIASGSVTTKKLRPKFGAGISYNIPETNLVTSLEASRIVGTGDVKTDSKAIPNADMIGINLTYSFN